MPDTETISPAQTAEETTNPDYLVPRDWYFTFGFGQRLYARHYTDAERGAPFVGQGVHLDGYYVVIHGLYHTARARMCEIFGPVWSFQYRELPDLTDIPGSWTELIKIPQNSAAELCPPRMTRRSSLTPYANFPDSSLKTCAVSSWSTPTTKDTSGRWLTA